MPTPKNYFPVKRVNLGLNTRAPSTAIPQGALTVGDNVEVRDGVLASAPGFTRISSATPKDYTYQLDGDQQHFWGRVDASDTNLKLTASNGDPWTIEVFFRLDGLPKQYAENASPDAAISVIAYKGGGSYYLNGPGSDSAANADGEFCWGFYLFSEGSGSGNLGKVYVRFNVNWDSTGVETLDYTSQEIDTGKVYHAIGFSDGTTQSLYVHEAGTSLGTVLNGAVSHLGEQPVQNTTDLYLGASPVGSRFKIRDAQNITVDGSNNTITVSGGLATWIKTPEAGSVIYVSDWATPNGGFHTVESATSTSITTSSDEPDLSTGAASATTIYEFQSKSHDRVHFGLRGAVQEFRIWNDERTSGDIEANDDDQMTDAEISGDSSLVYYQRLTGAATDGYYFESEKGTAGPDSGQSPRLALMPRDATWRGSGHVLGEPTGGDATLDFDGSAQVVEVPNSYLYHGTTTTAEGDLIWPDNWAVTMKVTPRKLTDRATLIHFVPIYDNTYDLVSSDPVDDSHRADNYHWLEDFTASSTVQPTELNTDGDDFSSIAGTMLLEIVDTGGGAYRFRAAIFRRSTKGHLTFVTSEESSVAVSVDTEYTVTVATSRDSAGTMTVYVYVDGSTDSSSYRYLFCDNDSATAVPSSIFYRINFTYKLGTSSSDLVEGDRVWVSGFTNASNNGLFTVAEADASGIRFFEGIDFVSETDSTVDIWLLTRPGGPERGDSDGSRKFAMSLGTAIWRTRQENEIRGDPEGVDVWYDHDRAFDGEIRQVMIATPVQAWSFEALHNYNRSQTVDRESVAKLGLNVVSCWKMDEGTGELIEDIAAGTNSIEFREDPDHVWRESIIDSNNTSIIKGLFEHRYTTPTGETKKIVAIAGGTAYDVNLSTGVLTAISHGFRNDDGNLISVMRFRDSSIICAGKGARGNYHMWKDQLWRLDIAPPVGMIPFGLEDQKSPDAALEPGTYRVAFTYYSAYTGKESPIGSIFEFTIRDGKANLALGTSAEINQRHASIGYADVKGPWDLMPTKAANARTGFRLASWIGTAQWDTSAPAGNVILDDSFFETDPEMDSSAAEDITGTNQATYKRIRFAKQTKGSPEEEPEDLAYQNPFIDDIESATADELKALIEFGFPQVFCTADTSGRFAISSSYVGPNSYIRITDLANASNPDLLSEGGVMDWNADGTPKTFLGRGTGNRDHGFTLPASSDPQVTHLRMYRTLANDSTLRLAEEMPNGTGGFVHYTPDSQLVGEALDITIGQPPAVEFVSDFAGRAIFIKDPDQPQRVYFSQPGQPWNVPAENVIDFLDGDTQEITGVGRTEGALMLFKDDTTFVLHPPTNILVPFRVETRLRDIGCVAPFSVTNVHDSRQEAVFFAGEKGVYGFDTAFPVYLSNVIESIYRDDISVADRSKIVAVHDRRNDAWLMAYPTGNTTLADGTVVNDRMLVLDYSVGAVGQDRYGWTRMTNIQVTIMSILSDTNEVDDIYFVDVHGFIYKRDVSDTNYGVGSLTDRTVTASAYNGVTPSITIPQATLGNLPTGYKGLFITIVDASDTTGETRESKLVIDDDLASPSVLTLDSAVTSFTPANGDSVLIGSIESEAVFGEMSPFGAHVVHNLTDTFLRMTKEGTSSSSIKWWWQGLGGIDNTHNEQDGPFSTLLAEESVTLSNQKVDVAFGSPAMGRRLAFRITSFGPDQPFTLREFTIRIEHSDDGARLDLT